jgi:hypothetical protein
MSGQMFEQFETVALIVREKRSNAWAGGGPEANTETSSTRFRKSVPLQGDVAPGEQDAFGDEERSRLQLDWGQVDRPSGEDDSG